VPCRHSSFRHGATSPCRLARSRHPTKFCTSISREFHLPPNTDSHAWLWQIPIPDWKL
jgi:hypothetical protein